LDKSGYHLAPDTYSTHLKWTDETKSAVLGNSLKGKFSSSERETYSSQAMRTAKKLDYPSP